jgi:hypothetical protein
MAGYSINRIPSEQRVFLSTLPTLWTADAAITVNPSVAKYFGEGSLQTILQESESIYYNTNGTNGLNQATQTTHEDVTDTVSAFVWVKSDKPVVLDFTISVLLPPSVISVNPISTETNSIEVTSGEWTLLRMYDLPQVVDEEYNYPLGMTITVSDIDGGTDVTLNISHPVMYCTLDFINNPGIIQLMSKFPEFVRDQDANAQPLPYQFIRFMEAISIHTGEISDLINQFIYQDISEGKDTTDADTLSILVDPIAAKREYLPWLAQFSGTQIINPTTGFTPWENLPATWQQIDLIDAVDTPEDAAPWELIQSYNTQPAGLVEFLRWQASTGYYGVNSGTKEAIIESVKRVLVGTKTISYEIVDPFAWTIKLETLLSETPDTSLLGVGDSVDEIIELVEPSRPLGFKVLHELV